MSGSGKKSAATGGLPPKAVVGRLSLYLREIQHLLRDGQETTSSTLLGKRLGITAAQVRKDLAYFGQFGYPGIGYRCDELVDQIKAILGTDHQWPVAIVGVGNLGQALLGYNGFRRQGFHVEAAFDTSPDMVGRCIEGVVVQHAEKISSILDEKKIRIGIIAVPGAAAQNVADLLVSSGISAILNFSPVTLSLPEDVPVVGVDLAIELEQLSFAVVNLAPKK